MAPEILAHTDRSRYIITDSSRERTLHSVYRADARAAAGLPSWPSPAQRRPSLSHPHATLSALSLIRFTRNQVSSPASSSPPLPSSALATSPLCGAFFHFGRKNDRIVSRIRSLRNFHCDHRISSDLASASLGWLRPAPPRLAAMPPAPGCPPEKKITCPPQSPPRPISRPFAATCVLLAGLTTLSSSLEYFTLRRRSL